MNEEDGERRTDGVPTGQFERLARGAGRAMDRAVQRAEVGSRQVYHAVANEAKSGARDVANHASVVVNEVKSELPRLRAELREMEARVRDRLR
ncbi:MAG: hypothetical protein SA339_00175 [Methanomassiliicoccus sp.]|nr:hypothetical protein [Methanomassiliicoccus sp.]